MSMSMPAIEVVIARQLTDFWTETGTRYGAETDLRLPWYFFPEDLQGTGVTLDDLATAFSGDLLAAASAFLRACEAMDGHRSSGCQRVAEKRTLPPLPRTFRPADRD